MRVCIVGCGAVGSLLRREPRPARRRRGVGVRPRARARRRDQRARPAALRAPARSSAASARRRDAGELPACDFGIVATKAMHTEAAIAATAARVRRRLRSRSVQNGIGNEEALAEHVERVIRGTTFPAGRLARAGPRPVGREGRHDDRPVRAEPGATPRRSSASPTRAPAPGMPTEAVSDARGPQWRKVIFNAATNPRRRADAADARPRLRATRACARSSRGLVDEGKAVAAAQGIELDADPERPDRPRRAAGGRLRPQGDRCSRTSRRAGRRRSTT